MLWIGKLRGKQVDGMMPLINPTALLPYCPLPYPLLPYCPTPLLP